MFGKDKDVIARRRTYKAELVRALAEVCIRCKNGGRTLHVDESADVTDVLASLWLRARDSEPELKAVLMTAKGCRTPPKNPTIQGMNNLYDLLSSVASGGCGEGFAVDLGKWAKNIVDCNPDNAALKKLWADERYDERLIQAKRDGENELAAYLKRPAQRPPESMDEAIGYLAYYASEMDQDIWNGIREDVRDSFDFRAGKDSYMRTVFLLWKENLTKLTYKKALESCVKQYPDRADAARRTLEGLR